MRIHLVPQHGECAFTSFGQCDIASGGNTASGTQLQLGACGTTAEQQWALP